MEDTLFLYQERTEMEENTWVGEGTIFYIKNDSSDGQRTEGKDH